MTENQSDWRQRVAKQIVESRNRERKGLVEKERDGSEYAILLFGVKYFLDYIRQNKDVLGSNIVYDIGAGATKAIAQIAKSEYGKGLHCKATVLTLPEQIVPEIGIANIIVSPAETLRGIKAAGLFAVNSLAYSQAPDRAIDRLDQSLVPGGVVKATFRQPKYVDSKEGMGTHEPFTKLLIQKGYNVVVKPNDNQRLDIVLAVKQGGLISAEELFSQDFSNWAAQAAYLKRINIASETKYLLDS